MAGGAGAAAGSQLSHRAEGPSRSCRRRAAVLYAPEGSLGCRRCYGLAYKSQQQSAFERGLSKAHKIILRLGGSGYEDEFPEKPKGIHWRTYERLCRAHDDAEVRAIQALMRFAGVG